MHRRSWRSLLILVTLLFAASTAASTVVVLAQEATPIAGECVAPELPPGTPTPMEEMAGMAEAADDAATPEMAGEHDMASPAAEAAAPEMAMATPVIPTGTPADAETTERVTAAIAGLAACYNTGNFLALAALFTPAGLMEEFGLTNPYDLELAMAGGPPLSLISVDDVQVLDDGGYSADVVTSFGGIQLTRERWILVEAGDFLLVERTPDLAPEAPAGAVTIEAEMVDYAFVLSQDTLPANTPLVFKVTNTGEYPHELLMVQMAQAATPEMLLTGELTFNDIGFYGVTFSEGGQPAPDLVLLGLNPGTYYLICMVDIPEGVPHLARGMVAEVTVE